MSILDDFKNSTAWDNEYQLPLVPMHNNPGIYCAYSFKIMKAHGIPAFEEIQFIHDFEIFAEKCRVAPGLFNRWPEARGGVTSHDEIMGMAYISRKLANEILMYLYESDGIYCNVLEELTSRDPERFNVFRLPFLEPFLRARAGYRVGLWNQIKFMGFVMSDYLTRKRDDTKDAGGMLRLWLMLDTMDKFKLCKLANDAWRARMKDYGWSPKRAYEYYLAECPVFHETAPSAF
jgi:hypothetical protein